MKIKIITIALSVVLSGVTFAQETERTRLEQRLTERGISKKQAVVRLAVLRKGLAGNGELNRPNLRQKPEISDEVKAQVNAVKELRKALQEELKAKLNELGNDASREEIKATVESFKENNQYRIEEIKATFASIREQLEAIHPEKPTRPELTNELKAKVHSLQSKRKEMQVASNSLRENLKNASKKDREALITTFKEENKRKHQEIKTQAQEIKKEIRGLVETEATRTSDL